MDLFKVIFVDLFLDEFEVLSDEEEVGKDEGIEDVLIVILEIKFFEEVLWSYVDERIEENSLRNNVFLNDKILDKELNIKFIENEEQRLVEMQIVVVKNIEIERVDFFFENFGLVLLLFFRKIIFLNFFFGEKCYVDCKKIKDDFDWRKCQDKYEEIEKCYFEFFDSEEEYWVKYKFRYKLKKKYKYKYKSKC